MKFHCSVTINLPLQNTVELFKTEENLYKWQDGLQSIQHLEGTKGEVGAKSKMHYKNNKFEFDLFETILVSNLPTEFTGWYVHEHMENTMSNTFTAVDDNTTRYDVYIEYVKLKGVMIKIMAFLRPGMFRKQTQKWLDQFKKFAESHS